MRLSRQSGLWPTASGVSLRCSPGLDRDQRRHQCRPSHKNTKHPSSQQPKTAAALLITGLFLCVFSLSLKEKKKNPVPELPPLPDKQLSKDLTSLNVSANQLTTHPHPTVLSNSALPVFYVLCRLPWSSRQQIIAPLQICSGYSLAVIGGSAQQASRPLFEVFTALRKPSSKTAAGFWNNRTLSPVLTSHPLLSPPQLGITHWSLEQLSLSLLVTSHSCK